ncbi:MAG TPA: response regulator transcription factor [Albitalea sp.]|uniref:winged helix-turn-helix transcriptional regulator n=1 Tax=Piscinibacter sp. TaxID=1903157 RepID=UPI002ED19D00
MKIATLFSSRVMEEHTLAAFGSHDLVALPQAEIGALIACLHRGDVDAVVLEDDRPQLAHWLPALHQQVAAPAPVIIVGHGDTEGIMCALRMGAADYASTAAGGAFIVARVQAQIELRRRLAQRSVLQVAGYELDADTHTASHADREVTLTGREFGMAWLLFHHRGQVVNFETLATRVWGRSVEITKRSIEQHAYRLRRKLGPGLRSDPSRLRIQAVYGVGYRLDAV